MALENIVALIGERREPFGGLEAESLAMGYSLYVRDTIAKQWYEENAVC
jgi:TfoX/Sxy family transcriptional regulator of competence genes